MYCGSAPGNSVYVEGPGVSSIYFHISHINVSEPTYLLCRKDNMPSPTDCIPTSQLKRHPLAFGLVRCINRSDSVSVDPLRKADLMHFVASITLICLLRFRPQIILPLCALWLLAWWFLCPLWPGTRFHLWPFCPCFSGFLPLSDSP